MYLFSLWPIKVFGLIVLFCICVFLGFSISREYLNTTSSVFTGIGFAALITTPWILFWVSKRKLAPRSIMKDYHSTGEILPADEMKRKYNLSIENYRPIRLNPKRVPAQFHDLIAFAQKWGIGDDIIRDDLHQKVSQEEKQALIIALEGRHKAINEWLDSFGNGKMTEEAAAFMYMLEGFDEMGLYK
jgi:hypothetical protein